MKSFLIAACLMTVLLGKAQIVNIPDANFRAALIGLGVDANNDGAIQETEALAITALAIPAPASQQYAISDLTGIRSFTNLQKLTCMSNELTLLDVSGLTNLKRIDCSNNQLTAINTTGCSGLQSVIWEYNNLKNINLSGYANLDSVNVSMNDSIKIFNAENCPRLKWVNLSESYPGGSQADTIDLKNCDNLDSVILLRFINVLDISGCDKITSVRNFGSIKNFIARNCRLLAFIEPGYLWLSNSSITHNVDVTGCTNLISLSVGEAGYITNVDLSTCPNLRSLFLHSVRPLYVNLKNGTSLDHFWLDDYGEAPLYPAMLTICADEFEIDTLYATINQAEPPLLNINSYCSFTPGGSFNEIKGSVKLDLDNNGCDNMDRGMPSVPIKVTTASGANFLKYTQLSGGYEHYFDTGHFTLTPYFPYPYFTISPATTTVNFDTANNLTEIRNFCISPAGAHNDLEITFLPLGSARPGFNAVYQLIYKNRGTTTLSGNVQLDFDNSKMNFTSASETVGSQSTGQLVWNYSNLQPFESKTFTVTFYMLPPPVNNPGDTVAYLASITPFENDETAFDNSFLLKQIVTVSSDPNEKKCLEGSKIDISKIGEYLHYLIHFQNEGTDTAFNVVVADTLSDKLNWNTFEFIGSSHSCDPVLKNNKAEFIFENIRLPYKAVNEPASNGWVAFKIKPKPSVVTGDSLNNTAAIYFDFNMPVITNRATTVVASSSTPVAVKLEYFTAAKKENANWLYWKASCDGEHSVFVIERSSDGIHFSSIGSINTNTVRCQLPYDFTDNNPVAGKNYYRLKMQDSDGSITYSKILVVGNTKVGFEITAVSTGIIYFNSSHQQQIKFQVIAADGKLVCAYNKNVTAGNGQMNLQLKNPASGIYTLIAITENGVFTRRFIK